MSVQSGGSDAAKYDEAYDSNSSLIAAAHELKSPLALIRQITLIIEDQSYKDESERQELLKKIKLTSERSLRLVEALTRSSRLSDIEFAAEPVHMTRLCEDVAHELSPFCKLSEKEIELKLPSQPVLAYANYELLRSVAFSLCDNALSHGEKGSRVTISTRRLTSQGSVRLSVHDNGPRLEKNVLEKLKQRLGVTPQPINRRPASSGLGLYVAGQFAEAMDGKLGMIAHRKSGTTFFIQTPIVEQLSLL